jgi:hypothetical protein
MTSFLSDAAGRRRLTRPPLYQIVAKMSRVIGTKSTRAAELCSQLTFMERQATIGSEPHQST